MPASLTAIPQVEIFANRYKHIAVPLILIALGVYIILDSRLLSGAYR